MELSRKKVAMTYSPTRLLTEQARQFLQRKVTRSVAQSHRVGRDKQGLSNVCSTIGPLSRRWINGMEDTNHMQKRESQFLGTLSKKKWRWPTLPQMFAVPSALSGLTSLFGMGRGGSPTLSIALISVYVSDCTEKSESVRRWGKTTYRVRKRTAGTEGMYQSSWRNALSGARRQKLSGN